MKPLCVVYNFELHIIGYGDDIIQRILGVRAKWTNCHFPFSKFFEFTLTNGFFGLTIFFEFSKKKLWKRTGLAQGIRLLDWLGTKSRRSAA